MLRAAVQTAEETISLGASACIAAVIRSLVGYRDRNPRLAEAMSTDLGSSQPAVRVQREEAMRRVIHFFAVLGHRLGSGLDPEELELSATIVVRGVTDILGDLRKDQETFDEKLAQISRLGCRAFALEDASQDAPSNEVTA